MIRTLLEGQDLFPVPLCHKMRRNTNLALCLVARGETVEEVLERRGRLLQSSLKVCQGHVLRPSVIDLKLGHKDLKFYYGCVSLPFFLFFRFLFVWLSYIINFITVVSLVFGNVP